VQSFWLNGTLFGKQFRQSPQISQKIDAWLSFMAPQHEQTLLSASTEVNIPLEGYANLHHKNG
jgi:hypothetical protein